MRRTSRSLSTELWRELVEKLDEGVIVFSSDREVVIYANDEAARLLGYTPRDVLDLEKDDFISLCQLDRLEGQKFAAAFMNGDLPSVPERLYEVTTADKRLQIRPFHVNLENGSVMVLMVRENLHWRSDLISQTLMSLEMQSSLDAASGYTQTLLARLDTGEIDQFVLADLARIVANSINRAVGVWGNLSQLYHTDPLSDPQWEMHPVSLQNAIESVVQEMKAHAANSLSGLQMDFPADLPPVAASPSQLQAGLRALLEGTSSRIGRQQSVTLTAYQRRRYVQVDLKPEGSNENALQGYLIDVLPMAIAEQVILRHRGRLWLSPHPSQPSSLSFSLPIWSDETTNN